MTNGQALTYYVIEIGGPLVLLAFITWGAWAPVGAWYARRRAYWHLRDLLRREAQHREQASQVLRAADRRPRRTLDAGLTWRAIGAAGRRIARHGGATSGMRCPTGHAR